MAIIVEDGTIVAGANSYVSEADLTAYSTARGITLTGATETLLIQSMDYIESQNYLGVKLTQDQSLQWPRSGVYIDGYYNPNDNIPTELKDAEMAAAVAIDQGNSPQAVIERGVKKEKVDVIETEYMDNAVSNPIDPKITAMLKKLLAGGGSIFNPIVSRG